MTLKSVKFKAFSEMKSSDDNSPQLVQIGASILDQAMENSSDFSDHTQTNQKNRVNDQIYLHTVKLSNLLKSLKIHDVKFVSLKPNEVNQIKQQIDVLFDDLRNTGKSVSIDVGPGSSAYEALRIISFALMAISNNKDNSNVTPPSSPSSNQNLIENNINIPPTSPNTNLNLENHFSEPSLRAGSGVIEDNAVRLENVQLKNRIIAFQQQFESEKDIKNELMKQNAQLNSTKIDLMKTIDELTEKYNELKEKTQRDQEKLEMLKYERDAQYNIDSTQIEKLREKSVRDTRKIRELQQKLEISPDEVQNSYIASLLVAELDGAKDLLNYIKEEFQLDKSLELPRSILPQLQIAVEDRKKHPILAEQNYQILSPQPTNENNDILLKTQIESYQAQIEDLKNQLALAKSNVTFNANVLEKGRINEEDNMRDLLLQNYNLETQVASLKTENERLSAELHATNQYIKSSKESSVNSQLQQPQQPQLKGSPNDENSIFVLESEIKANKIKINELTDLSNKRKEKVFALNQNVQNLQEELKSKEATIQNLRMQIDKLSLEKDDLIVNKDQQVTNNDAKDEIILDSDLKLAKEENKKLNHALSVLYNEMETLTSDMEKEGKEKNIILELLQKHSQALSESENQLKSLQNQINKKDDEIHLFKQNNEKLKLQLSKKFVCKHQEVVENIQQFFFNNNNGNNTLPKEYQNQIMTILNSSKEAIPLILELLEYLQEILINSSNRLQRTNEEEMRKLQEQNNRLFIYISNLLVFIDQLANSGELQKWIIGTNYEIDYRSQLLAQYGRIDNFIKLHCKNNNTNNDKPNNINSNNNSNNTSNDDNICKEFITDFPSFVEKITNGQLDDDFNREHVLVMQLCFSSNDLLRKFADKLLVQNETLQTDINHIRRELLQTSNETDEKISEATKDTVNELQIEREKRLRVEDTLNKIAKKLRGSKTATPDVLNSVEQCLNLIDDDQANYSESESFSGDVRSKRSVQKEIKKAEIKKEQAYKASQIVAQKAKDKIKKLKIVIKSQAAEIEELKSLKDKYTDIKKENESLQQYLSQSQAENEKNEKALKDIHRQMKENETMKDSTFSKYKEESELQISSLQEELDDWKRKSECTDISTQEEVRRVKRDAKLKLKKMQTDLLNQVQRVEDTRSHFEPLLNELREKLNASRAAEKQLQEESQKFEIEKKQLKSELTTARIDLKMAKMKLNAAEEKVTRDKNLIESQYRMKINDLQSKNLSALEDQKNQFDTIFHSFLVSICQKFKDFTDFNEMITKESVEKTLDKICQKLKDDKQQLKVYEEMNSELIKLRSLLGLQNDESVLPTISLISKDASEFNKKRTELEEKQNELELLMKNAKELSGKEKLDEEWESWARRVYTLISDFSSTAQTAKELQFALEEALLGNIGQRMTTRRLGTLRIEKQILLTGLLANMNQNNSRETEDNKLNRDRKGRYSLTSSKNKDLTKIHDRKKALSIGHILIMISCIRRMQKISGHIKCSITSPKRNRERNDKDNDIIDITSQRDKGYPILNSND